MYLNDCHERPFQYTEKVETKKLEGGVKPLHRHSCSKSLHIWLQKGSLSVFSGTDWWDGPATQPTHMHDNLAKSLDW